MPEPENYRIIHLSKYYPPDCGGIETHVQTLARTQVLLGAEVHVVCVNRFDRQGCLSHRTQTVKDMDGDVNIHRVGCFMSWARFDFCPGLSRTIYQLINAPRTLLHLHTPNPTMIMALAIMFKRVPLVITHHSDVIRQKVLKYGLRPFEHIVYSQSSQILTTSQPYIHGSKFLQFYLNKLNYLPLGLDCSVFSKLTPTSLAFNRFLQQQYGELIWLAVGRLVYYKGLHIAIEALTLVPGTLIIIGIGPLEQELKTLAQNLGVSDRVVWLGQVSHDELVGAYHAAKSLWFPSNVRSEGFGLVQVEAMASGCPVINADVPGSGVPWVSRHELEGLTVPINNPVALAAAAKRLINDPGLHDRLSRDSRKRADYFSHITMAQRSFQFYDKVLGRELSYQEIKSPVNL